MRKKKRVISLLLSGCLLLSACGEEDAVTPAGNAVVSDEGYIDTLTPKNDFYGYINAKDLMAMDLDGREDRGTLYDLRYDVDEQLDAIIDEIAASEEAYAPGSNEQMIHDLYHQAYEFFEDGAEMDAEDTVLIDELVAKIDAVSSADELFDLWKELTFSYGIFPVLTCSAVQNLYDINENILMVECYFLGDLDGIKKSSVVALRYRDSFVDWYKRLGMSTDEATQRAENVVYTFFDIGGHTDLAYLSGDKELTECYHLYSEEEAKELLGEYWFGKLADYTGLQERALDKILIPDPEQLQFFLSTIDDEHLQVWKDCTLFNILDQSGSFLPEKYNMTEMPETTPQRFARYYVKQLLEEPLSEIYAERYFDESKRDYILELCEEIRDEYYVLINNSDWLSEEGKEILCRKLDTMKIYVGCGEPHTIDPEDAKLIGSTLLQTFYNFNREWIRDYLEEIEKNKEVDPFDQMSPSTVNACYLPSGNYIIITAAILNQPVFDINAERAWNLGRIGNCIGHEISHAFDSTGVNYDEYGNYDPGRMPAEDIEAFKEIQEKTIEYYNSFTVLSSHVKGKLTLTENLADISGVQCMLAIAGGREEQQAFFESYAQYWEKLTLDTKAKELLEYDVHAPASVRVNAVVACFDEYYEIYDVTEGDPMYVAPEDRIRRW